MKKHKKLFIIIPILCVLCVVLAVCLIQHITDNNYKKIAGYEEYISDNDSGYSDIPYFYGTSSMLDNKNARNYYNKNCRVVDDYLVTDYEDGICINQYYGRKSTIDIPETLDGKPVVKLGGYLMKNSDTKTYDVISAFAGIKDCKLNIPYTVKYIEMENLFEFVGFSNDEDGIDYSPHVSEVKVDKNNKYYYSEDGVLFTKDKKTLLFLNLTVDDIFSQKTKYTIPDYVENFSPCRGVSFRWDEFVFGENIKTIDAYIYDEEGVDIASYSKEYIDKYLLNDSGYIGITIKGYKGTVAEEWAKKYRAKFIPLD